MELVSLRFWHGGLFKKTTSLTYLNGCYKIFDKIDPDQLCFFWLQELALQCGKYSKIDAIYYLVPGLTLDDGLRRIFNDKEVLELAKYVTLQGTADLFVVHRVNEPDIVEDYVAPQHFEGSSIYDVTVKPRKKLSPKRPPYNPKATINISYSQTQGNDPNIAVNTLFTEIPHDFTNTTSNPDDWEDNRPESPLRYEDLVDELEDSNDPAYEANIGDVDSDCETGGWGDPVDYELNDEVEEELQDQILGVDSDTDDEEVRVSRENITKLNARIFDIAAQLQKEAEEGRIPVLAKKKQLTTTNEGPLEFMSDYENSEDEILTPGESEEDDILGKKRRASGILVNEFTDFNKFQWKVGMRFESRKAFQDAVTKYSILQGRHLTFTVSDQNRNQRLGVSCKKGCPFRLYGSWDSKRVCFVVKGVDGVHKCNRDMKSNKQMKSTWLAEQFLEIFKSRPHWPAAEIVETVRRAYKVIVDRSFAYKIKYYAHRKLHGSMKEHYNKVGRYMEALKQLNPDSFFILETSPPRDLGFPVFKRLFICFDALSNGWLAGCRRVICLDGCFLKTFLGGMLLAAVGRDANDQMYPIAYAVVEGENNESWNWFLLELKNCLKEKNEGDHWTFISDQQKGILNAVENVFTKAEHRNCARHVFANWHKTYKGDELKGLFWRAARAYNEADYTDALTDMESLNPAAVLAFKAQNPKKFCRAFVSCDPKCDVVVNNMAETFNGYIINARTKHLLGMLEDIRSALMYRLVKKKAEIEKDDSILCPRIRAKLEKEKEEIGNCTPLPSTVMIFQVHHILDSLTVDLENKTCTCRKWQLTDIPCCHALSCIYFKRDTEEPYVDECYHRVTNLKAYSGYIKPCVGERHWPRVDVQIDPPPIKIGPGRPRRKRRKDPHENPKKPGRLTRHGNQLTCSVCKSTEHTKRKCPDKNKVTEPQIKRRIGRPKTCEERQIHSTGPLHHNVTAEPTRTSRGGKTIRGGRGSRGRGRASSGRGEGIPTSNIAQATPTPATNTTLYPISGEASTSTNFKEAT